MINSMTLQTFTDSLPEDLSRTINFDANKDVATQMSDWMINALYGRNIYSLARHMQEQPNGIDPDTMDVANQVVDLCEDMQAYSIRFAGSVKASLLEQNIASNVQPVPTGWQYVSCELHIEEKDITSSVLCLQNTGYFAWYPWLDSAQQDYAQEHASVTLINTIHQTNRVTLRWREENTERKKKGLLQRFKSVVSSKKTDNTSLGPFLGTPRSVIPALLRMASVSQDDTLLDLGCGDASMLIDAVKQSGCRAIGVESDEKLVVLGRQAIQQCGLESRIEIRHTDINSASLDQATVVFLFLPVASLRKLIPELQEKLKPGSRIVAHEQRNPRKVPPPDRSELVVTDDAMTVVHLWNI